MTRCIKNSIYPTPKIKPKCQYKTNINCTNRQLTSNYITVFGNLTTSTIEYHIPNTTRLVQLITFTISSMNEQTVECSKFKS